MICPKCSGEECRRSHREDSRDFAFGVTGLRPWRCRDCQECFYAWSVPIAYVHYAHCLRCGNLAVKRISPDYVAGSFAWLFRIMRLPAYRCAPCRNKFFSIRRHLRVVPTPQTPAVPGTGSAPAPANESARDLAARRLDAANVRKL